MASTNQQRIEQLFEEAIAQHSAELRAAFLERSCAGDAGLRGEVEQLLAAHDSAGTFLEASLVDPEETLEAAAVSQPVGSRIGRYKILQEIGEGGFGVVYMAAQQEPVHRTVALKIIKLGMDTKRVIARFEAERQALALMDHPNIARVLDAGATDTGRPYFVMELVRGVTITEYCNQNRLPLHSRLELFLQVCQAVQHAHQKGVIHRDIKPSNVLVTLHDGKPVPKIIDFGIAKATSQRLTDKTLFTEMRQFIGTPVYMSPDQADVTGLDIDTRTDIYSLGVLLYELLTGTTPFEADMFRSISFEEIRRIIREVDPPTPSARLLARAPTAEGQSAAQHRRNDTAGLIKQVRGDLDWIVMRSMEKDRTRRYETASELASDIQRHLRCEPVQAGPPGAGYRLSKFLRRNRAAVIAVTGVTAALLLGLFLATIGLIQANAARDALEVQRDAAEQARIKAERAEANAQHKSVLAEASAESARQEALKAEAAKLFLDEMLASVDPRRAQGREVTVRYVLDEAAQRIAQGALGNQPDVEASVCMTLGRTYEALGLTTAAETHVRRALTQRLRLLGEDDPQTLVAQSVLCGLLVGRSKNPDHHEAEALARRTTMLQRQVRGEDHPETLATRTLIGQALAGQQRLREAEWIHRDTLDDQRRILGEEHVDTLRSVVYLGAVLQEQGRRDEAEHLTRQALNVASRVLGEEHPDTMAAMNGLALILERRGESSQAEKLYRQILHVDRRVLGPDHPRTQVAINHLLRVLDREGRTDECKPLYQERLANLQLAASRTEADALALYAYAMELVTCKALDLRDPEAALPIAEQAVTLDGRRDPDMLDTLAQAYEQCGRGKEAIPILEEAVKRARAGGPYDASQFQERLDYLRLVHGDLVNVTTDLLKGLSSEWNVKISPTPWNSGDDDVVEEVQALMMQGNCSAAERKLRSWRGLQEKDLAPGDWRLAETTSMIGDAVAGQGAHRYEEAERLLMEGFNGLKAAPREPKRQAIERLVRFYESSENADAASEWRARLEVYSPTPPPAPASGT